MASTVSLRAQHEADNWIFGNHAGLSFSSGNPVAINFTSTPPFNTEEGSSSISDQIGHLLFYTDGRVVWNKSNANMPATPSFTSGNLFGASSSTQSALIVPLPNSQCQKYLIFTVDDTGTTGNPKKQQLNYSLVDLSAQAGLGDVIVKNTQLKTYVSEKLAAVKDSSGTGFWVVAHGFKQPDAAQGNPPENKEFYAYHVTGTTTGTNLVGAEVTSSVGTAHQNTGGTYHPSIGQMKISPDGLWIASAAATAFVEVLNFNAAASGFQAGQVTAPAKTFTPTQFLTGSPDSFYGLEFSPDSRLLYVSTVLSFGRLFQIDFQSTSPTVTPVPVTTQTTTTTNYDLGQLQLGPDYKIYLARDTQQFISVINVPNSPGATACGFVDHGPSVLPGNSRLGLPTMIGGSFSCAASAACATITDPTVRCNQGVFTYSFTLTNNSTTQTIQNLLLSPPLGAPYSISPTTIHLTTPLQPGGHTAVTGTITNASPGDHVCINVALADENFVSCCTVQVCFDLPACPCLKLSHGSLSCVNGANTYNIDVQNLTGVQLQQIFVVPISPPNLTITPSVFPGPVAANGIKHLTFTITGAAAGANVCFRLVPLGSESQCCPSERICVNLLKCVPPPATQKRRSVTNR